MKTFSASTLINAPTDTIWALLTDGARWPDWNLTIDSVEGRIAPGEKITVYSKVNPGRAFPLRVTEFVPGKRMVWTGGMPLGLFKGERTYTLTEHEDSRVEFAMREAFSGLLAPLMTRSIPDLQPSFEGFAEALKRQAEGAA